MSYSVFINNFTNDPGYSGGTNYQATPITAAFASWPRPAPSVSSRSTNFDAPTWDKWASQPIFD